MLCPDLKFPLSLRAGRFGHGGQGGEMPFQEREPAVTSGASVGTLCSERAQQSAR
jgi:hypothetical protein